MARTRKPHPADLAAAQQIARASYFTVFRARGRDMNQRERHDTLAEARASAAGDCRALVYAVTPENYTVLVPPSYKPG